MPERTWDIQVNRLLMAIRQWLTAMWPQRRLQPPSAEDALSEAPVHEPSVSVIPNPRTKRRYRPRHDTTQADDIPDDEEATLRRLDENQGEDPYRESARTKITDRFITAVAEEIDDILRMTATVPREIETVFGRDSLCLVSSLSELNAVIIPNYAEPSHLCRPFDIQLIMPAEGGYTVDPAQWAKWGLRHYQVVGARDVRGQVAQLLPFMVREAKWRCDSHVGLTFYGTHDYKLWQSISPSVFSRGGNLYTPIISPKDVLLVPTALGLQFVDERIWSISFRRENTLGLRLWLPRSVLAKMFRDRAKLEGRTRRAALRHVVREHWRELTSARELETLVRMHLRGELQFSWFDLACEVNPCARDIDAVVGAQAKRVFARNTFRDRRLRQLAGARHSHP